MYSQSWLPELDDQLVPIAAEGTVREWKWRGVEKIYEVRCLLQWSRLASSRSLGPSSRGHVQRKSWDGRFRVVHTKCLLFLWRIKFAGDGPVVWLSLPWVAGLNVTAAGSTEVARANVKFIKWSTVQSYRSSKYSELEFGQILCGKDSGLLRRCPGLRLADRPEDPFSSTIQDK